MKKLAFLILTVVSCGFLSTVALADVLSGPSCTVTAKVVDKGTETRELSGVNGNVSEYESKYLKLEVQSTKPAGDAGDCSFVAIGNVFKTDGGSNPDPLKIGDTIEAGVELNSTMGPSGDVAFIRWAPISVVGSAQSLSSTFELETGNKPEKSATEPNKNGVVKTNKNSTEAVPAKSVVSFSLVKIVSLFGIVLILVIAFVYYLKTRRGKN